MDEGVSLFQNEISVIKLFGSQQASFCTDLYYFACVARVMHHTSIPSSYHNCSLFYLNSLTSHHCSHHFPHSYKQTKVTQLHQLQCLVSVCQKRLSPSICSDGQFAIFLLLLVEDFSNFSNVLFIFMLDPFYLVLLSPPPASSSSLSYVSSLISTKQIYSFNFPRSMHCFQVCTTSGGAGTHGLGSRVPLINSHPLLGMTNFPGAVTKNYDAALFPPQAAVTRWPITRLQV